MSASATQWKPPPAQMPLTAVMTGFAHLLVPGGEVQVEVLDRLLVALHADAVAGDLGDVDAGLERPALAGVHDHPDLRGRASSSSQASANSSRIAVVHGVELLGPVVDQPADRAVALDLQAA